MDSTLKYQLIEKIVQTNDESLLQEINALLESASGDWWHTISEAERAAIDEGLGQADRGEVIPHEDAMRQIQLRMQQKRSRE
jgi:predicted transcriptional regulator